MQEKDFQQLAEKTMDRLANALDVLDAAGNLELEYQGGIITVSFDSGKQLIINKHAPSQQIWLSSPISGGLHFLYIPEQDEWQIADGKELKKILTAELKMLADIEVVL